MNDKDKSFFAKIILAVVIFVSFMMVLGLTVCLMKNKKVVNPVPQISASAEPTATPEIKDEIEDVALNFCTRKGPSAFHGNYTGYLSKLSMNFDNDKDKEIVGVCSTGQSDKEGLLYVLDLSNGEYVSIFEEEGSIQHQRFYDFQNLMIKDVDKDGIDEIIYEGKGWAMSGGESWLKLYSPKYKEWFEKDKMWSWVFDESNSIEGKRKEETKLSPNLENKKRQAFKNFLIKQQFTDL